MKRLVVSMATALTAIAAVAASRSIKEIMKTPVKDLTPEEHALRTAHMRETKLRIFGENIIKPGSQQGKIAIVNAQDKLAAGEVDAAVAMLYNCAKFRFDVTMDESPTHALDFAAATAARRGAQVALVIVNDADTPAMLVAPEDRWAIVNVGKLDDGIPAGALYGRMFAARCRKEIVRAFSLLCGGGSSQFAGNMMETSSIQGLDTVQEFIPIDMANRYTAYLATLGVKPAHERTYRQACKEGWAPAPTNEMQRAIWEKVHAVPKSPMRIEFDPKKGR